MVVLFNEHWSLVLSDDLLPGVMGNKSEGGVLGVMAGLVRLGAGGTGPALPCAGAVLALLPVPCAQEKKAAELAAGLASSWGTGPSLVDVRCRRVGSPPGPGPGPGEGAGSQRIPWVTAPPWAPAPSPRVACGLVGSWAS